MLISLNASGQSKNDKKIIVTVTDTVNLFNRIALSLYDKGYTLENKDQELGFLSTNDKPIINGTSLYKMKALIKGNTVTFTGSIAVLVSLFGSTKMSERTYSDMLFYGMKNSPNMISWREVVEVAKEFGTLSYSK